MKIGPASQEKNNYLAKIVSKGNGKAVVGDE